MNPQYNKRSDRLSAQELAAIEILVQKGWIAIADVFIEDGIPAAGDGSKTYAFKGRKPVAIILNELPEMVQATDPEKPKKRGRPKKVETDG